MNHHNLIRDKVVTDEQTAIEHIHDGMTIAIGGFITAQHPMAILRGLAKRGVKGMTVIGRRSYFLPRSLSMSVLERFARGN